MKIGCISASLKSYFGFCLKDADRIVNSVKPDQISVFTVCSYASDTLKFIWLQSYHGLFNPLHSQCPKLYAVLAILSLIGLSLQ